jgi:hypothetical protein
LFNLVRITDIWHTRFVKIPLFVPLLLFVAISFGARADQILLNSGDTVKGSILRRDGDQVVVSLDYGVVRYSAQNIKSVNGKAIPAVSTGLAPSAKPNQFPRWKTIVTALSSQTWATDFQQIPATVIDKGVMKNVPYVSFKCGGDYEMNIYGDPDNPAGVEIGVYRSLLTDDQAKKRCVAFIASILGDKLQRDVLLVMDQRKSLFERDGMSLEITPETDEDAYGAWWVSAYKEKALDGARASDKDLTAISVPRVPSAATAVGADPLRWSPSEMGYARGSKPANVNVNLTLTEKIIENSKKSDPSLSTTVPIVTSPPINTQAVDDSGISSGRVYVRGYYRKNGTYVSGYTRSR